MPEEKKNIIYNASDIEKYHKGLLSRREMHAIEKAALDDPFLADAMEGYSNSNIYSANDHDELTLRLEERVQGGKIIPIPVTKKQNFAWWRIAAMIVLVAGAGMLIYQLAFNKKDRAISLLNETKKDTSKQDASTPTVSAQSQHADDSVTLPSPKQKLVEAQNSKIDEVKESPGSLSRNNERKG